MLHIVRAALVALAVVLSAGTILVIPAQADQIDINTATKAQLDVLPGIGPARADAIIKGRPYRAKDELVKKNIIPESVYDGIKDRIRSSRTSRRLQRARPRNRSTRFQTE
jgi:DNA uptake protein ComE-like DNA-binding protein